MKMEQALVEEYFRSILGSRPFTQSFTIGGVLVLKYRTLTHKETLDLVEKESWLSESALIDILRIAFYTVDSEVFLSTVVKGCTDKEELVKILTDLKDSLQQEMYSLYYDCHQKFVQTIKDLREDIRDPNFTMGNGQ